MRWSLVIGAMAVVLAGCSGAASSPTATGPAPVSNAPTAAASAAPPAATEQAVDSILCGAVSALRDAQNQHASPLATYLGDMVSSAEEPSSADRATALAHATAIAATFLEWGPKIDGLKSAEFASVIVLLKHAYVGYGQGVSQLKPAIEGTRADMFSGEGLDGLQAMREGRDSLDQVLQQVELLDAAGSIDCPVSS